MVIRSGISLMVCCSEYIVVVSSARIEKSEIGEENMFINSGCLFINYNLAGPAWLNFKFASIRLQLPATNPTQYHPVSSPSHPIVVIMVGKKKRGNPGVEEVLQRPWCYYCKDIQPPSACMLSLVADFPDLIAWLEDDTEALTFCIAHLYDGWTYSWNSMSNPIC